jgi:glycopeptide antibiotics resistance protein
MALGKVGFMRHLGFLLETLLVIPLGTLISFLPCRVGRAFGHFGGALVFSLGKSYIK